MIEIGLVGCGRISEKHFEAIKPIPNARISACCDIIPDRAMNAAKQYDIPFWTTNYNELLQKEKINLISICTPSGLHAEHGILAAKHRKNILSEKPLAVNTLDAKKLITACHNHKVNLYVVFQNRLNPPIAILERAIKHKTLGTIYMILANVLWFRSQDYYDRDTWRGTLSLDGGAFTNQASHYIDLIQWLGGPIKSVLSTTRTLGRNIEAEDSGSAILHLSSGAIASINVTMLTYPKNLEGSLTIICEKGTIKIGGMAVNEVLHCDVIDKDLCRALANSSTYPDSVYGFGHSSVYRQIIDSLLNKEGYTIDGHEGLKSLEIIEAIHQSSKIGSAVSIPR